MMSSMFSLVMVISLLLGNFTMVPMSMGQIRSGELKFKVETKLNNPLNENVAKEMGFVTLDNLSAEFDIKYKTSEDLKKLEMQCEMLLSNSIDEPIQILYWANMDYSDRNIPKILFIFKQQNDDKYSVINIESPAVNNGMTAMGMFSQFLNTDMVNSTNKRISDSLNQESLNITEKDGALTAVMDEATLKGVVKQIALSVSEYIAPYFAINMMAYSGTTVAENVAVVGGSDGPTAVYIQKKYDEKTELYSQRITYELMKMDNVSKVTCDVFLLEDEIYHASVNVEVANIDSEIDREIQRIVNETDENILLTGTSVSAPAQSHNIKMTTLDELKLQFEIAINEFFAKLDSVKIFDDNALVFNMIFDDKNNPKNVNYAVNINTNLFELVKSFGGYWNDELPKEDSNLDLTITFDYIYDKVNEDIIIDYPTINAENSIDIMGGSDFPNINVNEVNVVVNNDLIKLENKPFINDGVVYLPLREVSNLKGITDENIIWDDGTIKIKTPNLTATLKIDSDEIIRNNQKINVGANVLLQGITTYIPVSVFGELGIGGVTNTFFDENDNIIGCVILIHKYTQREMQKMSFIIQSDVEPMWEKYIYMASDKEGVNIDITTMFAEHYLERTNLIIASGEPTIIIGKYDDEFLSRLEEQGAIFPAIKVDDEFSIVIPKTIKNVDVVYEIANIFIGLVNQQTNEGINE